jgi:hypothetical protein
VCTLEYLRDLLVLRTNTCEWLLYYYARANYLSVDPVRFSFDDSSDSPVARLLKKTLLKIIRGQLLPWKMRFENTKFPPYVF